MKKVTALFLAMLMCMALAVPALAGETVSSGKSISSGEGNSGKVKYEAMVQEPTIDVTVPSLTQRVILNPYQIRVTSDMRTASGDALLGQAINSGGDAAAQASILSSVLYLHNKSTAPLKMSLELEGNIPSTSKAVFAAEPIDPEATAKQVFIFVDVGTSQETLTNPVALSNPAYTGNEVTQGVFRQGKFKMENAATLTRPQNVANGNYLPIKIGGACTTTPTDGWTKNDEVELSITFTFQATNNNKPA